MKIPALVAVTVLVLIGNARAGDAIQLWVENCAACHGKDGKGDTRQGRKLHIIDFTNAQDQSSFTDAKAAEVIHDGINKNGIERMKAFGDKLSDAEIKALVAHVRAIK